MLDVGIGDLHEELCHRDELLVDVMLLMKKV